jgi:hypothetical protein
MMIMLSVFWIILAMLIAGFLLRLFCLRSKSAAAQPLSEASKNTEQKRFCDSIFGVCFDNRKDLQPIISPVGVSCSRSGASNGVQRRQRKLTESDWGFQVEGSVEVKKSVPKDDLHREVQEYEATLSFASYD